MLIKGWWRKGCYLNNYTDLYFNTFYYQLRLKLFLQMWIHWYSNSHNSSQCFTECFTLFCITNLCLCVNKVAQGYAAHPLLSGYYTCDYRNCCGATTESAGEWPLLCPSMSECEGGTDLVEHHHLWNYLITTFSTFIEILEMYYKFYNTAKIFLLLVYELSQ